VHGPVFYPDLAPVAMPLDGGVIGWWQADDPLGARGGRGTAGPTLSKSPPPSGRRPSKPARGGDQGNAAVLGRCLWRPAEDSGNRPAGTPDVAGEASRLPFAASSRRTSEPANHTGAVGRPRNSDGGDAVGCARDGRAPISNRGRDDSFHSRCVNENEAPTQQRLTPLGRPHTAHRNRPVRSASKARVEGRRS